MPGGGGTIVTSHVKNLPADGTKGLFVHTGPMVINRVTGLADYDFRDFDVICIPAINTSYVLAASKKSGIKSMADLLQKAKAAPNTVIYGAEMGGYTHLQGLIFNKVSGVTLKIVDTGSASEKVVALLSGRIDVGAVAANTIMDYHEKGDLTILAQYNDPRNENLSQFPSFKEANVDFVENIPYVMAFAKGTDPAIVAKMDEISRRICEIPEYAADLKKGFWQPVTRKNTKEAIESLTKLSENYMQYSSLLK
jgi:tripartite-type tricarboxylate transporter receptor subunit TctC